MQYLLSVLMIFILSGCCQKKCVDGDSADYDWYGQPPLNGWSSGIHTSELTRIMIHYTTELQHNRHLRLEHSLVYYDDQIEKIRMDFITQDVMELREARELLVDVAEGILDRVNGDSTIASELDQPFTADNLQINIDFESFLSLYVDPMYIGWAVLEDGECFFYAADLKAKDWESYWWHARVEPYYKAYENVVYEREAEEEYKANLPPSPTQKLEEHLLQKNKSSAPTPSRGLPVTVGM